ncbi:MAG: methyltransferase domain-containing protein [Candidatus Latescibacteria bacterium]|nr:methyltransferase domain-containing protein [Candidatus Latescibacterota bacterium]
MSSKSINEPYQALAEIYDYVMRHVDYKAWAIYVDALLQRYGGQGGSLAELACGTGNATVQFQALGYAVSGIDGSAAMVRTAAEKARLQEVDVKFSQGDLRALSGLGPFDAAVCLYDSFNYLRDEGDVEKGLASVYGLLRPGGLFVFDVCTQRNSLRYFLDARDQEEGPGFSYRRHSYYQRREALQYNRFHIRFDDRPGEFEELHTQRIYTTDELLAFIATSPFELLGLFDGFSFDKGSEYSERIHYALRRPPDAEEVV